MRKLNNERRALTICLGLIPVLVLAYGINVFGHLASGKPYSNTIEVCVDGEKAAEVCIKAKMATITPILICGTTSLVRSLDSWGEFAHTSQSPIMRRSSMSSPWRD